MTRTAVAAADGLYGNNVIDFCAYRGKQTMECRRYVLVPVEENQVETTPYIPRPRRTHRNAARATLLHTCLNLAVILVTLVFTVELLAVI